MNHGEIVTILLAATTMTDVVIHQEVETETTEAEMMTVLPVATTMIEHQDATTTIEDLLDVTMTEETMNHEGRDGTMAETMLQEGTRPCFCLNRSTQSVVSA